MFNNTSGAPAGTLAPQLPVPASVRPVHGVPGAQRVINLPPRPIAIWAVSLFLVVYVSTYPLQPLVGLEFTGAYMFAGMTMGLTIILPIVLGVVSAWYLNEGYEWARVVIIIEGALRMILDLVYVALCAHVFFDNEYDSQMLRVLFFGPFMTLEVLYAKLAFDFISRIVIIVLLCQPQVGRYIQMRGDLRRMGAH